MNKNKKGNAGYIKAKRNRFLLIAAIILAIALLIVFWGFHITGTRKNIWTVLAICLCLPGCYMLVEFFVMLPFRSIKNKLYEDIKSKTELLLVSYDNLVSTSEKIHQIDALVITNNTIIGYASNPKTNVSVVSSHLKELLDSHGYSKITIKIFQDYKMFLTRAEAMNSMEAVDHSENKRNLKRIRSIILSTCM